MSNASETRQTNKDPHSVVTLDMMLETTDAGNNKKNRLFAFKMDQQTAKRISRRDNQKVLEILKRSKVRNLLMCLLGQELMMDYEEYLQFMFSKS